MFTLRCLVDNNTVDAASLQAEHGVAFAIGTPSGQILFDTGQSGDVLTHNAAHLGVDLGQMDALALSHAHYDHTGAVSQSLHR
jgi:7,8-dihydropterin-6-yl-methyl-4-(beta-D-ribofuranosyl)aminobenzene 5'-phosphate synthase